VSDGGAVSRTGRSEKKKSGKKKEWDEVSCDGSTMSQQLLVQTEIPNFESLDLESIFF